MRHLSRKVVLLLAPLLAATILAAPQTPPTQKASFEVASVKPSASGSRNFRFVSSGGRFSVTTITLLTLLKMAYQPQDGIAFLNSRIIGAPGWVDTDRFDIEATTEDASPGPIPREKLQPMLQSLLEDRFQLKPHREVREMPVYFLTVGKGGAKLKLSEDQSDPRAGQQPPNIPIEQRRGMIRRAGDGLVANAVPLSFFTNFLSSQLGRPVLDKTGLEGVFDFKLTWTPSPFGGTPPVVLGAEAAPPSASDPSSPSIFTAIQELGLKLEAGKAPLEVLLIDSVQKPSEN